MTPKRIALGIITVTGIVLVLFPLVTGMWGKTQGVEHLTSNLRSSFAPEALSQTRTDIDTVQAMADQLQDETLRDLPPALGMAPEQFDNYLLQTFPDAASGITQLDVILPRFQNVVAGLEAQAPNFRLADEVPTNFLPSTTIPLLFLISGLALSLLGAAALRGDVSRSGRAAGGARATFATSAVLGAIFISAPFLLSVPAKAQAIDELTTSFGPVFTDEGAAILTTDFGVIERMTGELQGATLPALARGLQMDTGQFQAFMIENYPDVATGISQIDSILPRIQGLVTAVEENTVSFRQAASIPTEGLSTTTLIAWFFIPGAALLLAGTIGVVISRRNGRAPIVAVADSSVGAPA